jgi:beta-mannanase
VAQRLFALAVLAVALVLATAYLTAPPGAGAVAADPATSAVASASLPPTALVEPSLDPGDTEAPPTSGSSPSPAPGGGGGGGGGTAQHAPPIALGAFIAGASNDYSKIDAYARMTGTMPKIVMWYQSWAGTWSAFAPQIANAIRARGAMPIISWEPSASVTEDPTWSLRTIIDGTHDAYIRRWTRDVAAWGHPIYVRLMYEMNGWWAPWCATVNGNSAPQFVAAWRHIVDIARSEGAANIRWIWSPNVDNDGLGVPFPTLYPGDSYVDWVALDGFNRGTSWSTTTWVSMKRIFAGSIARLRELSAKPLMIAETGSSEVGGDKANWLLTSFARIPFDLPDVRAVIWYDKWETAVGIDWRVDSSASSLAAYREVATSAAFSGRLP